ncbi:MAG: class I tRNA ligase family protein [Ilumatobacteraceae bacterium]
MSDSPTPESGLAKAYEPGLVEAGVYDRWDSNGWFQPHGNPDRNPFVVVMPPPNVTGELHIGHALFVTVEDIMVRWHRMLGDPTLWTPGADHAGIADSGWSRRSCEPRDCRGTISDGRPSSSGSGIG